MAVRIVFPPHGSIKKEQQEHHWHRLVAISSKIFSRASSQSFCPQAGKRQEPTLANLFVDSFIPRCHVITWPPKTVSNLISVHPIKIFLESLELFILSTCPNHRKQVSRMIWFSFLDDLGSPKIRSRTSSLVIRCFHEKCPIDRRHLWSNTWSLCKSPERNGHVSHPYRRVERTVALYTRPLVAREASVQRQRWLKLEKVAYALEILTVISLVMFPFVLMQLPR